jgi:hypothetical protein
MSRYSMMRRDADIVPFDLFNRLAVVHRLSRQPPIQNQPYVGDREYGERDRKNASIHVSTIVYSRRDGHASKRRS